MIDALIIDACRTPRGIGKIGKGALSGIHPQQLGATVLRALAQRTGIDTAEVDDMIWGTSSQRGLQSGDLGRMSALDAGYDVRASGVTLDRFCGSGITASTGRCRHHVRHGGSGRGRRHRNDGEGRRRRAEGPFVFDSGNMRLRASHPQTQQGICADTIATMEGITREDVDGLGLESQRRAAIAIDEGRFSRSLIPVYHEDGTSRSIVRNIPRPQTTLEGLAGAEARVRGDGRIRRDTGATFRSLILQRYPDVEIKFVHHAGNSSGVVDGSAAVLLASPEYAKATA